MKITKDFTFQLPLPALVSAKWENQGKLQIDGKAYCQHPADKESYDYDIEDISFVPPFSETPEPCTAVIKALIAADLLDIDQPIMNYVDYLFSSKADAPEITDLRQDKAA